jgi:medium-chain acyl-[acyl-carrier-protein] hydrolase
MEHPFTQLSQLIQAVSQALFPLLNIPFALFGHSMGALISSELARELCRQYGVNPVSVFVSSSRAPQLSRPSLVIHTLPDKEFVAELCRLNGTPSEVLENDELMEIILPVLRADFALYENYVYEPDFRLDCPISAFGGLNDRRMTRCDLEGWQDQTSVFFSLKMFPGDHFFVNTTESLLLAALAHELR